MTKRFLALLGGICLAYTMAQCLFKLCMCRGNKLCLASFVNLDKEQKKITQALEKQNPELKKWQQVTKHQAWHIRRKNGITLYARAYLNSGNKWVVIAHGYGGNGTLMLYAAKRFHDKGYNVLLPDLLAHGKSCGKFVGWGWKDKNDICDWCSCINKRCPAAEIVLYGVSMGAAAVLMAAGCKKMNSIKCVVSDCSYTSLKDIFYYRIRRMLHLPPAVVMCWLKPACKKRIGINIDDVSVIKQVQSCDVPIMFCHGDRDRFVPTDNALELYCAAKSPKKLMLVHGAGHGIAAFVGGEQYWSRVFDFVEKVEKLNR